MNLLYSSRMEWMDRRSWQQNITNFYEFVQILALSKNANKEYVQRPKNQVRLPPVAAVQ